MTSKLYKFWTTTAEKKAVAASSFEQLLTKGAAKCSRSVDDIVRITMEDGTELDADDEEVFELLSPESPLIVEFKAVDSDEQHDMNAYFTTPQAPSTGMDETPANSNMADDAVTNANPTSSAEDERNGADVARGGVAHTDALGTVTAQLASGELDYEGFLLRLQEMALSGVPSNDPNHADIKKKVKVENEKSRRSQRSNAYQDVLEELHQPIKEKVKNGSYSGEGGSLVYQHDLEDLKRVYLATENLGPMKGMELDKFLCRYSGELAAVEDVDVRATAKAEETQAQLLTLLLELLSRYKELEKAYQNWMDTRSDTINWFNATADSLDGTKEMGNKAAIGTASVSLVAGTTGIVVVSVAMAPVTFGASLALGLGLGSAAVGLAAGGTGIGLKIMERQYNTKSDEEQRKRLEKHNEQIAAIEDAIGKLQEQAEAMRKTLVAQFGTGSSTLKHMSSEGVKRMPVEADIVKAAGTVAKVASVAARPVRLLLEVADDAIINAAKMTGQVADDVLNAAKAGFRAANALGSLAIVFGGIGIALDTYTLVTAIKDVKAGSKSELATKFREIATELETNTRRVNSDSAENYRMVKQAEELITHLLKRYSLNMSTRRVFTPN